MPYGTLVHVGVKAESAWSGASMAFFHFSGLDECVECFNNCWKWEVQAPMYDTVIMASALNCLFAILCV